MILPSNQVDTENGILWDISETRLKQGIITDSFTHMITPTFERKGSLTNETKKIFFHDSPWTNTASQTANINKFLAGCDFVELYVKTASTAATTTQPLSITLLDSIYGILATYTILLPIGEADFYTVSGTRYTSVCYRFTSIFYLQMYQLISTSPSIIDFEQIFYKLPKTDTKGSPLAFNPIY